MGGWFSAERGTKRKREEEEIHLIVNNRALLIAERKRRRTEAAIEPIGPFPNPFRIYNWRMENTRTLLELRMMLFSGSIRAKDDWWIKRHDKVIASKWRLEALDQGLDERTVDYVLAELDYYDSLREGGMQMSSVEGVWQADDWIPHELSEALQSYAIKLEGMQGGDWHPGSNEQVLDLVHPSLFCYVHGRTRQTDVEARPWHKFMGGGTPTSFDFHAPDYVNDYGEPDEELSRRFQWLPSEFDVDKEGHVIIRSYINNLHPVAHKELYPIIAKIFERFVPLFNKVLTGLVNPPQHNRLKVDTILDDNEEFKSIFDIPEYNPAARASEGQRPKIVDIRGRRLQVIVKMANIVLTPERPEYPGGVWHVEGAANERIVASGIYYYDVSDNETTESRLLFRAAVEDPDYEQGDSVGVEAAYGIREEAPMNQKLGSVITRSGRCIAFPNCLQHRVYPFRLLDPSKSAHRKILVFFLVDPDERIVSTLHVPPQQRHWFGSVVAPAIPTLPPEVVHLIVEQMDDWPMSMEEAKSHRAELMVERKFFIEAGNETLFERPFSLCEH